MNEKIFDCVIIGAGPAGLGAAVYAARAGFDVLLIEKNGISGGQIINTAEVDNYLGLPGIGGFELGQNFNKHVQNLGVSIITENVSKIELEGQIKIIYGNENKYYTETIILAMGAHHAKLEVPGEDAFLGRGVSYCATCDGAFFRKKKVIVVGGGDVAVGDALFLSKFCENVTLIHRRGELRATKVLQDNLFAKENINIVWDCVVESIQGDDFVTGVEVRNVLDGQANIFDAAGVFVAVGMEPETEVVRELVEVNEKGYIIAGEDCVTSIPGIFAAGDIRTKKLRQVITAVSDGANAVNSALEYMQNMKS